MQSKPILLEPTFASVAIYHQMTIMHVQVGKNFIEDVLLNGGYGVHIITEKLRVQLSISKLIPAPYNLHMAYQTIEKPLGLIKDLKFCSWNSLCSDFYYNPKFLVRFKLFYVVRSSLVNGC